LYTYVIRARSYKETWNRASHQIVEIRGLFFTLISSGDLYARARPVLVYLGYGLGGAAFGYVTPLLITGVAGVLLVTINLEKQGQTSFDRGYFNEILSYSAPIFVSALLSGIFLQSLNFILPLYASDSAIGNLSAATNFTVLISFILTPISTAMFPLLSKLKPSDSVFQGVYNNIIKYEAIVVYPIAAGVIALSVRMVGILYGADYQASIVYIQIIMLNYLFLGLGSGVNGILLNSQKKNDIQLRTTLIYLLVGVPMGILLIPRYGVLGYQATTILAPMLGLLYTILWIRKNLGISLDLSSTGKIMLSAIVGYAACIIVLKRLSFNPWVELFLGGTALALCYIASILFTGALTSKNIYDIKQITDKNKIGKTLGGPVLVILMRLAHHASASRASHD
jgi:O-antigen/teichoic acid export membrane protein